MAKSKQEVALSRGDAADLPTIRYGRKLNNRGRALVHDALERLTRGDMAVTVGTHGRNFADQLAHELLESPLASILRIDAATPSDEGEDAKAGQGAGIVANISALYLQAVQHANKPEAPRVIEGTIGVQAGASPW